jgi:diguanylate cyclase (GGDEF)-like protein
MRRVDDPVAGRRLRRWMAAVLVVTLLSLTIAAVLGSWRQAVIVRNIADESTTTDSFQHASYLAVYEMALVQASLREPDGEERRAVAEAGRQTMTALEQLPRGHDDHGVNAEVVGQQRALQAVFARYLALLDHGDTEAAAAILEEEIEPLAEQILAVLLAEQQHHVDEYTADLARAGRDSRLLQFGTLVVFLLGLVVLTVVGLSNRAHRLLIERMAAEDPLTALPNRAAFHARAGAALARGQAGDCPPTVLMLDLDGFKDVNDTLGHHIGDLLLIEVGRRLRTSTRAQDTVARLSGDEFAVLIADADPGIGETAATRIIQAFDHPFVIDGVTLDIEVSIGIVTAEPGDDVYAVIRHADTAMYAAKEHRLGHTRFDPKAAPDTAARLTLLGDLRRALDRDDEIRLHYQPKVSVDTGELNGAEALARWQHPVKGLVAPDAFIPLLEGTSLVHRFTAHVLRLALDQEGAWLDAGHHIPVAVNVSTRCLLDPAFPDTVAQALLGTGVPGNLLCIEITENTVMADPTRAIDVLRRIRALGVKVSIDDFGTGYSSMAYLKTLPVDELKVDRSFVQDMATDRNNYVIVESAVGLGHNLGLTIVAEGVEDEATIAALRQIGCDTAQGYHIARPLPPDAFAEYLTRSRPTPAIGP